MAAGPDHDEAVLSVKDLHVRFRVPDGEVHAVCGVDMHVASGETVAIVGESGSGKSQSMMAAMGLLAANGWAEGAVHYRGRNLVGLSTRKLNHIRGEKITMIFQEPMTSLDPLYKVGRQLAEPLIHHRGMSRRQARKRDRAPGTGADLRTRPPHRRLSVRTLRRSAPARHDRHGAGQ